MCKRSDNRNANVDCFRVAMLIWVVIYHIWVINGSMTINNRYLDSLISLGGEIGVTGFFVLSGWSVLYSLEKRPVLNISDYKMWLKRRFLRIAPEYYLSIIIVLFFSNGAGWFSRDGVQSIIATIVFCQNILPGLGAVNGVLWTMSVTVIFYIIAPFLFFILKKKPWLFFFTSILFTLLMKYVMLHYVVRIVPNNIFYLSRATILTDLDNFTDGMLIGFWAKKSEKYEWLKKIESGNSKNLSLLFGGAIIVFSITCITTWGMYGKTYGIHADNYFGYVWHMVLAFILSLNLYGFILIKSNFLGSLCKWVEILAKHQYGIYVFHLLVIQSLVNNSEMIQMITSKNYLLAQTIIFLLSIFVGLIMSEFVSLAKSGYHISIIGKSNIE